MGPHDVLLDLGHGDGYLTVVMTAMTGIVVGAVARHDCWCCGDCGEWKSRISAQVVMRLASS